MKWSARRLAWILLVLAVPAHAQRPDPPDRARRRTPVVEVFEACRDAVVNISTTTLQTVRYSSIFDELFGNGLPRTAQRAVQSVGSGFVVHESGYIVSNAHVVARASDIQITFADGQTTPADLVAVDQEHDLAILKVAPGRPLKALTLGDSDDIMIGETVVAIGNPLGLQHTVTTGIVSALDRDLDFGQDTEYRGLIQTDAAINPGNSGGPLLNINGELIGVNTAIRGDAQNVGFAIAVNRLWELLPAMLSIERRERVRFGLEVRGAPAVVTRVNPGSPADNAGLRAGDVIRRCGGQTVRHAVDFYVQMLEQRPGARVSLAYTRGDPLRGGSPGGGPLGGGPRLASANRSGEHAPHERAAPGRAALVPNERLEVASVLLEEIPRPDGNKLARELLGLELAPFPEDVRRRYRLPDNLGLLVTRVVDGGPAARAEIDVDDLIRSVDRIPVSTLEELGLVLESIPRGQRVYIEGVRLNANPPFRWRVLLPTW